MTLPVNDAHCHFFSRRFFETLGRQRPGQAQSADDIVGALGWDPPGSDEELADRWVSELDRHAVSRAALMASVPQDETSVAAAVARHPQRFVGFFMLDATGPDAVDRVARAVDEQGLRGVCLFPAMHRYALDDARTRAVVAAVAARRSSGAAVFVHCGALSVGVRKKLGLPSRFDVRFGNPLDLHAVATEHPDVPFIIPHFGAGMLREALMVADLCSNIYLDTSSSNKWLSYHPGLTLAAVFRQAVGLLGASRLIFGTDSSFFPRGWQRAVHDAQLKALADAEVDSAAQQLILHGNFDRLFPAGRP